MTKTEINFRHVFIRAIIACFFTLAIFPITRHFRHKPLANMEVFGYHVHHAVLGMLAMILMGLFLTLFFPYIHNKASYLFASIFGSAIAIVADQWDMWFYLKNDHPNGNITGLYWAMGIYAFVFISLVIFRKFHTSRV